MVVAACAQRTPIRSPRLDLRCDASQAIIAAKALPSVLHVGLHVVEPRHKPAGLLVSMPPCSPAPTCAFQTMNFQCVVLAPHSLTPHPQRALRTSPPPHHPPHLEVHPACAHKGGAGVRVPNLLLLHPQFALQAAALTLPTLPHLEVHPARGHKGGAGARVHPASGAHHLPNVGGEHLWAAQQPRMSARLEWGDDRTANPC